MSFWQLVIISCEYPFYTHFVLILEIFPTDIIGINSIEKSYFIWKRDLKRSNELFWLSRGWMAISKQQKILKLKIIEKIIHVLDWNSLPQLWLDHGVFTGKLCSLANSGSSGDPAPHLRSYLWLLHTRITHLSLTGECLIHITWNSELVEDGGIQSDWWWESEQRFYESFLERMEGFITQHMETVWEKVGLYLN